MRNKIAGWLRSFAQFINGSEPKWEEKVYLSRRNLLTLLSKLDRQRAGGVTACAIRKYDKTHAKYPQTMDCIEVTALEDEEYYFDRPAGTVHPADTPK